MTDDLSFSDFLVYLDSIRRLYPGGIPKSYIEEEFNNLQSTAPEKHKLVGFGSRSADLMFITTLSNEVIEAEDPYIGAAGDLLQKALQNGMKIDPEQVFIAGLTEKILSGKGSSGSADLSDAALAEIDKICPEVVVICGKNLFDLILPHQPEEERGNLFDWGQTRGIVTHSIQEVLNDVKCKREFWLDLQTVMQQLRIN